jgi:hypothetical protein
MAELSRCDDCLTQVEPMDWWGHREWHKRQEEALEDLQASIADIGKCDCNDIDTEADITKLEEQMQDVFNWVENEIFPRLEKIEGAAIFTAFADKQLETDV